MDNDCSNIEFKIVPRASSVIHACPSARSLNEYAYEPRLWT